MDIFQQQLAIAKKKSETKNLSANEQAILQADDMLRDMGKRLAAAELVPLEGYSSQIEADVELRVFGGNPNEDLRNISRMAIFNFGYLSDEKINKSVELARLLSESIDIDEDLDEYRHVQLVINWQYVNI